MRQSKGAIAALQIEIGPGQAAMAMSASRGIEAVNQALELNPTANKKAICV